MEEHFSCLKNEDFLNEEIIHKKNFFRSKQHLIEHIQYHISSTKVFFNALKLNLI